MIPYIILKHIISTWPKGFPRALKIREVLPTSEAARAKVLPPPKINCDAIISITDALHIAISVTEKPLKNLIFFAGRQV